jgi:hypothetical protein
MRRYYHRLLEQFRRGVKIYVARGIDDFLYNRDFVGFGSRGIYLLFDDEGFVLDYDFRESVDEDGDLVYFIAKEAYVRHSFRSRLAVLLSENFVGLGMFPIPEKRMVINFPEFYVPKRRAKPELITFRWRDV